MKLVCLDDYEKEAYRKLSTLALDYYRSGADGEDSLRRNIDAFKSFRILPRFLRDVTTIDMSVSLFGDKISCPIGASPTAMHKLAHPDGELATAKGVDAISAVMTLSTLSTVAIEDVAQCCPRLHKWFQLYLFTDRNESLKLVQRAERAGFKALVLTVDAPKLGFRRRDVRNDFKVPAGFLSNFEQKSDESIHQLNYIDSSIKWSDVAWLCEVSRLPVLLKGILTPEDSKIALDFGVAGIVVSNHGGRQLDGVPAPVEVLHRIVKVVNGRCPVFVDGGIRTGTDVLKCLALGATMVFIGRPILWGLSCEGEGGVKKIMEILRDELELAMKLSGCCSLAEITPDLVVHESQLVPKL